VRQTIEVMKSLLPSTNPTLTTLPRRLKVGRTALWEH